MENTAAWSMGSGDALDAVLASAAALAGVDAAGAGLPGAGTGSESGGTDPSGPVSASADPSVPVAGGADPLRQQADDCLNKLARVARLEAATAAYKVQVAAEFAEKAQALAGPATSPGDNTGQEIAVIAEVACALTIAERSAAALLCDAVALTTALPLTLTALQAGNISWQHAQIMVDETANLEPAAAAALEAHFLDPASPNPASPSRACTAGELIPGRFRHKARTWRERHHPVSIEKRHTRSLADRRLDYRPDRDGMAWLSAYLPAHQAAGIWNRATAAARTLQGPHEHRKISQIRADLAATWLLTNNHTPTTTAAEMTDGGGEGVSATDDVAMVAGSAVVDGVPSPRAQVLVTVPVFSLLGLTDEPAMLDGYGPIPPSMAQQLLANGADAFHRVLIDPRDGAPLEIGRTSYRVTNAQRQWLRLRDGKCTFPGCNNHSLDNETDHLLAWADGGTTAIPNLGSTCLKHHRLKHTSTWTPTQATTNEPPGWISPTGRYYPTEHPDWEPTHWPDGAMENDVFREHNPDFPLDSGVAVLDDLPPDEAWWQGASYEQGASREEELSYEGLLKLASPAQAATRTDGS